MKKILAVLFHWCIVASQSLPDNPFRETFTQGSLVVGPNTTLTVPQSSQGAITSTKLEDDFTYTFNIKSSFSVICFGYLHQSTGGGSHLTLNPLPTTDAYYAMLKWYYTTSSNCREQRFSNANTSSKPFLAMITYFSL